MIGVSLRKQSQFRPYLWLGLILSCLTSATHAAMIVSTDDTEFQGEMIEAGINTLTIDDIEGGYTIVPWKDVQALEIDIQGGDKLKGNFHEWRDGVFVLQVGDRLIGVQDGSVTFIMSAAPDPALPSGGPKTRIPDEPRSPDEPQLSDEPQKGTSSEQPSPLEGLGPAHRIQM